MGTTPSAPFHQKYPLTSRRLGLLAEPDFTWVKSGASKTCKVVRLVAKATTSSCSGGRSRGEGRPPWGTTPGAAEQTREEAGDARKGRVRSCRGQERSHEDQGRRGTARRIGEEADSHPPGRGGGESDSRHGDHCSSPFAAAAGSAHGSPRGNHHPLGEDYIRPEGEVRVGSRHHLEGHTHGGETATSCDHRAGCLVGSRNGQQISQRDRARHPTLATQVTRWPLNSRWSSLSTAVRRSGAVSNSTKLSKSATSALPALRLVEHTLLHCHSCLSRSKPRRIQTAGRSP